MTHIYLLKVSQLIKGHVLSFLANEKNMKCSEETAIFSELRGGKLPPAENQPQRLIDEANILMIAGGEAITQLLTILSYHLVANPHILARLREELDVAMPTADSEITWCNLAKLPYLVRVNHGLSRVSHTDADRLRSYKRVFGSPPLLPLDYHVWHPMTSSDTSRSKFLPE